ncbi:unnamed protein product [Paramecium octaurelia]|uniref:Uncharacterized protein n=1 Tax=Paramecium octaurelia TaxID=43137 RepID=A0A8S1WY95_PAROT|nr:unnamed protein product [Paramecium octaurelia]
MSIRLWDVQTGQQVSKLEGHTNLVMSVCFSPDSLTLVSGSTDMTIRLWDIQTGQQKAKFDGHRDGVRSVCVSPDGITLASGSEDKSIRLWDVQTGQQVAKLEGHKNLVMSVCFSPDGFKLISGSNDMSIRLWDVKQKSQINKSNNVYKDFITKHQLTLQTNSLIEECVHQFIIFVISQESPKFSATGALIYQSEFLNHMNVDLRLLFKQNGGCILENNLKYVVKN